MDICIYIQVEIPKAEPKFEAPFLGFTRTAEIWNSRACMIGLIGTFIVELVTQSLLRKWYLDLKLMMLNA